MKKCTKTVGISISFKGMSYRERIEMWWEFTKACLFQMNTAPKAKASSLDINIDDRPKAKKEKK